MSRVMAAVYDRVMRRSETECLKGWRAELLRDVRGDVLEVGAGTGANLAHYGSEVSRLVLVEPDAHMARKLRRWREPLPGGAEIVEAPLGSLSFAPQSFDAAVTTLVLCSVPDQIAALGQLFRLVRPGGRLVFLEHVAAAGDPGRLRWQRFAEPLWRRVAGNCHLTRNTEGAIVDAGFTIEWIRRESIRTAMPIVRPSIRGVARKV